MFCLDLAEIDFVGFAQFIYLYSINQQLSHNVYYLNLTKNRIKHTKNRTKHTKNRVKNIK